MILSKSEMFIMAHAKAKSIVSKGGVGYKSAFSKSLRKLNLEKSTHFKVRSTHVGEAT